MSTYLFICGFVGLSAQDLMQTSPQAVARVQQRPGALVNHICFTLVFGVFHFDFDSVPFDVITI